MDITTLFKACVKTIKTRNKAFGLNSETDNFIRCSKSSPRKSEFIYKAKEVVAQITRLRDFLLDHRKAYLNFSNHLPDVPVMTDVERDKIDFGAQRIMSQCSQLIKDFKHECIKLDGSVQLLEHRQAVLELVEMYLKAVCKIYTEQNAIRVKRAFEIQKLSRLDTESLKKSVPSDSSAQNIIVNGTVETKSETKYANRTVKTSLNNSEIENFDDQLTAEELQMFEQENEQIFNELNNLSDEVKQIESKIVKIAELQEIFTDKVLQQDKDIDRIVTTVVGSTENIKDANDQIRMAIQRNAGLRVYIMFFLLVMSLSLLFLDWYNE